MHTETGKPCDSNWDFLSLSFIYKSIVEFYLCQLLFMVTINSRFLACRLGQQCRITSCYLWLVTSCQLVADWQAGKPGNFVVNLCCEFRPHAHHRLSKTVIVVCQSSKKQKKTLEVLSLLRPIVHDTSKTAKITWFILVLHWAMYVIYDFHYIHGPMEY